MGFPNEFKPYFDEHGISVPTVEDIERATLATGINAGTGQPISDEYRRKLEAKYGGGSSTPAPAASTPASGQTEKGPAVQKHEHTYSSEITKEPTCTTDGEQSKHCLVCDSKTEITTIPATGHTESVSYEVSTPATMFAAGEEVMHCAVCSDVIATRVIPQDTASLYAMIGGIVAAVIVVIAIILVVSKKLGRSKNV